MIDFTDEFKSSFKRFCISFLRYCIFAVFYFALALSCKNYIREILPEKYPTFFLILFFVPVTLNYILFLALRKGELFLGHIRPALYWQSTSGKDIILSYKKEPILFSLIMIILLSLTIFLYFSLIDNMHIIDAFIYHEFN